MVASVLGRGCKRSRASAKANRGSRDASPILSKTSVKGLYFNCGWGTGGFKATPGSGDLFAHTIANDEPHKLNAAFNLNRFISGDLVDEHGAAAVAH